MIKRSSKFVIESSLLVWKTILCMVLVNLKLFLCARIAPLVWSQTSLRTLIMTECEIMVTSNLPPTTLHNQAWAILTVPAILYIPTVPFYTSHPNTAYTSTPTQFLRSTPSTQHPNPPHLNLHTMLTHHSTRSTHPHTKPTTPQYVHRTLSHHVTPKNLSHLATP